MLHTVAPREFDEAVLNFLVHAASLVAGAIENAELYEDDAPAGRRADRALAGSSEALAAVTRREELYATVTRGARDLLTADACRLYRYEPSRATSSSWPPARPRRRGGAWRDRAAVRRARSRRARRRAAHARERLRPGDEAGGVLMAAVVAGDDRLGVLTCRSLSRRRFALEDVELLRAAAHLAAAGLTKIELIERLTAENLVHEMFAALGAGAIDAAEARGRARVAATSTGRTCSSQIERAPRARGPVAPWPEVVARVEARLRTHYPAAFFHDGRERAARAARCSPAGSPDRALAALRRAGRDEGVVIGITGVHRGADDGARALREAADAARMALVLAPTGGGALATRSSAPTVPRALRARRRAARRAVRRQSRRSSAYDERRQTQLLGTLEQFLANWRSIASSAQALHIHPNTLRQRLERIREAVRASTSTPWTRSRSSWPSSSCGSRRAGGAESPPRS